jgi:hypothetical protein
MSHDLPLVLIDALVIVSSAHRGAIVIDQQGEG